MERFAISTTGPRMAGGIRSLLEGQPASMRGLHITVNPDIVVNGDDATVRADLIVLVPRAGTTVVGA